MHIIGHKKNIDFLEKGFQNNRLAQSYLFYGPENIGKTKITEYFICRLLCSQKNPCFKCRSCQQVLKHFHPDNLWVKGDKEGGLIKVEQARQIKEFLFTSPFSASHKIVIIEKADQLTLAAANSLLKILEEPPKNSIIILIASNIKKIPSTIVSRCQVLRFASPLKKELVEFLKNKYSLKQDKIKEIINLATKKPGSAIYFAENLNEFEKEKEALNKMVDYLENDDIENRFKLANFMLTANISIDRMIELLLIVFHNLILIQSKLPFDSYSGISFKKISKNYSLDKLQIFVNQILRTKYLLQSNVNKKLAIENLLINF